MPGQPTFSIEQPLPSCSVTVELLKKIEAFVLVEMPKKPSDIFYQYQIELADAIGTATFTSINEYPHRYLPSRTKSIEISVYTTRSGITIKFRRTPLLGASDFQITCDGTDSRERARSIRDDFLRLLEPYETQNRILYSPWIFVLAISLTTVACFPLFPDFPQFHRKYSILLLFLTFPVYKLATTLKPYSTFETKENVQRGRIANWILLAICSALIGVIVRAFVAVLW